MSWKNGRRSHRLADCVRCMRIKPHEARSLCKSCYNKVREGRAQGVSLEDYPPQGRNSTAVGTSDADTMRKHFDPGHIPTRQARHDTAA